MRFIQLPSTFAVVAGRAGRHYIRPRVQSTQVARQDMINGQILDLPRTILACIIVASKDLTSGQFNMRARALNHVFQADDGRAWEGS